MTDRSWSDLYIPAFKTVLGPLLIDEATFNRDQHEATDLVFYARERCIGCRVRRPGYAEKYPWDFSLRASRVSGAKTELKKIMEGWGDWLVYAHAAIGDTYEFSRWLIVDLAMFRQALMVDAYTRECARSPRDNPDGKTAAVYFDMRKMPSDVLAASSHG